MVGVMPVVIRTNHHHDSGNYFYLLTGQSSVCHRGVCRQLFKNFMIDQQIEIQ
jgi:hypothetical protein